MRSRRTGLGAEVTSSSSSSSSSLSNSNKMRDRHKVTESAVDNDNGNDEDNDNDNIDGKESIKSILRTVILKVNRRESEDLTERILKDLKPQFLGSLIKFRLIYKDVNNVEDKTLSLLKSTLDGIDIDSAPNLYDILSVSIIEDMMSVEAADVESAVEKLAAIDNITTEDVERHFENKTNMAEIYRVLLEKYGKGIEEYRVLSSQNNSFNTFVTIFIWISALMMAITFLSGHRSGGKSNP